MGFFYSSNAISPKRCQCLYTILSFKRTFCWFLFPYSTNKIIISLAFKSASFRSFSTNWSTKHTAVASSSVSGVYSANHISYFLCFAASTVRLSFRLSFFLHSPALCVRPAIERVLVQESNQNIQTLYKKQKALRVSEKKNINKFIIHTIVQSYRAGPLYRKWAFN